jgi:signal transduction histidine kinase
MNLIVKELFEVINFREQMATLISSTLNTALQNAINAVESEISTGIIPAAQLQEVKTEMFDDLEKIANAITADAFLSKLECNAAAIITEHLDDETLAQLLEFERSDLGKKIVEAQSFLYETLDSLAVVCAAEELTKKGLI